MNDESQNNRRHKGNAPCVNRRKTQNMRRRNARAESKNLTKKFDTLCGEVTTKKVSAEEMEKLFS